MERINAILIQLNDMINNISNGQLQTKPKKSRKHFPIVIALQDGCKITIDIMNDQLIIEPNDKRYKIEIFGECRRNDDFSFTLSLDGIDKFHTDVIEELKIYRNKLNIMLKNIQYITETYLEQLRCKFIRSDDRYNKNGRQYFDVVYIIQMDNLQAFKYIFDQNRIIVCNCIVVAKSHISNDGKLGSWNIFFEYLEEMKGRKYDLIKEFNMTKTVTANNFLDIIDNLGKIESSYSIYNNTGNCIKVLKNLDDKGFIIKSSTKQFSCDNEFQNGYPFDLSKLQCSDTNGDIIAKFNTSNANDLRNLLENKNMNDTINTFKYSGEIPQNTRVVGFLCTKRYDVFGTLSFTEMYRILKGFVACLERFPICPNTNIVENELAEWCIMQIKNRKNLTNEENTTLNNIPHWRWQINDFLLDAPDYSVVQLYLEID